MALDDELQRMRHDITDVGERVNALMCRLAELERQVKDDSVKGTAVSPLSEVATPRTPPDHIRSCVTSERVGPALPSPIQPPSMPPPPPREAVPVPPVELAAESRAAESSEVPNWLGRPIEQLLKDRIDAIRKKTQEFGWEVSLGTYWLPRIAVVCISIAVVFFLSLAIKRWGAQWLPHLRVAVGYAVCAGLLGLAWRSEKKYPGYARVLYGGGFAVMYFVTFATHFVSFSRVFQSPVITLCLLAAVVVGWGLVAQLRQSKTVAVLVTALGHLTILLSTLTLERPGPFAMAGLLFLAAGSAFFLLKNSWYYVAALGVVGSYGNAFVVLAKSTGGNPYVDFAGSMCVLSAFLTMFAIAELLAPEELRRKTIPTWFRSLFVTVNTASFFGLGTLLVKHYEFTRPHEDLFRFFLAAALMLLGIAYLRFRKADPLYNAYITKAVVAMTLGFAARYGGSSLLAWLSLQGLVLLLSSRRSGLPVSRILGYGTSIVALVQAANVATSSVIAYGAPGYAAHLVQGAISVLAFFIASQLYERTDWKPRSPATFPFDKEFLAMLWQLDLIGERPQTDKRLDKPCEGLLFPYLYALAGAAIFLGHTLLLVANGHRFMVITLSALVLLAIAVALQSKPFGLVSAFLSTAVALLVGAYEIDETVTVTDVGGHISGFVHVMPWPFALVGLVALALIALASETKFVGVRTGLTYHQMTVSPYVLYVVTAFLTGFLFVGQLVNTHATIALAVAAIVTAGLALVLHANALSVISMAYLLWAGIQACPRFSGHIEAWRVIACGLVVLGLLLDRYYHLWRDRIQYASILGAMGVVASWVILLCYLEADVSSEWRQAAATAACFFYLAYGGFLRSPVALAVAVVGGLLASLRQSADVFNVHQLDHGLVAGFVMLAVFWVLIERMVVRFHDTILEWGFKRAGHTQTAQDEKIAQHVPLVPITLMTALLLLILYKTPHLLPANLSIITMSWFGLAVLLFVVSLPFHQSFYRYAGLAVVLLSLVRLFKVDMRETDALFKVAAFAVLGFGLLAISYGYFRWRASLRAKRAHEEPGKPPENAAN